MTVNQRFVGAQRRRRAIEHDFAFRHDRIAVGERQ
jgi:hypothetical protein